MGFLKKFAILVALLAIGGGVWWKSDKSLKIRVAVEMFGWDGFADIVKANVGERMFGKRETSLRVKQG